ncbi:MFS transporter, DHA1 family, bicyclomycin/chloramphenicol resistance protein [Marinobacter daqiaonensis]|uniref:Bcr/CflA family efflux transporter n=1 Tax=Marinobacter daqiaonensis TaxID=650891 RepID=A0A1I6HT35_9GAMM|nr:Bcr/CflA family efflux MFS transporter [Marinobacter daqiaonensis]SFR57594.1 MFS transporter, DHA1 family, bicyclomycin/chloramphenicol resistance protein [Marinobacter daqiaonensis]
MSHFQLALLLGMTVALGPLALDAYLPAFPAISADLGVGMGDVGLTLSAYVGALGLAQLVGGPLSDRYGRQVILLGGLLIFGAAAFMVSRAASLDEMLLWRVVQGIGGAFCAVSVPAIVRDTTRSQDAARLFGLIGLIMFIAPAVAPSMGALLLATWDWPAIFLMLTGYAMLLGVVLKLLLFSRLPPWTPASTPVKTLITNYSLVLRHATTMRFIGIQVACFSAMLVFITHASFIYQEWFGLSSAHFSALFAANVGMMALLNVLNRRLLLRIQSVVLLRIGVMVQFAAMLALLASAALAAPYWVVAGCIILAVGCMGAIIPNNMANALEYFPDLGGTASALLGATQFTVAGIVSALSAIYAGDALLPIVLIMAGCILGAVVLAVGAPGAVDREALRPAREL